MQQDNVPSYRHARWDECTWSDDDTLVFEQHGKYTRHDVYKAGYCAFLHDNAFRCAVRLGRGEQQMCQHHFEKWLQQRTAQRAAQQQQQQQQQTSSAASSFDCTSGVFDDLFGDWNNEPTFEQEQQASFVQFQQQTPLAGVPAFAETNVDQCSALIPVSVCSEHGARTVTYVPAGVIVSDLRHQISALRYALTQEQLQRQAMQLELDQWRRTFGGVAAHNHAAANDDAT